MLILRRLSFFALAIFFSYATAANSQAVSPAVRIVNQIDEGQLVRLTGNTHPAANARNDLGRVSPSLPMTGLVLLLSRSPEQQAAFDKFVANQYDPHSPDFHHWLQPAQVGEDFGPSQTDIQTLSNWLAGHGFSVGEVGKDRMTIRFSGTASQVETAFHTEIHNFAVGGVAHIANMSDPQIPAALAPAVAGVKGLHNFFPRPLHKLGSKVQLDRESGKWRRVASADGAAKAGPSLAHPEFGINVGTGSSAYVEEDVAPYDFATIYNVLPLWTASTPIDGTGQKIAIAGTSNINLADVTAFRSTFGLPAYTSSNQPQVVIAHGTDPGDCSNAASSCIEDLTENTLDVEWSGAVAKGAQIVLVVSGATSTSDDTVYDSSDYVVQNQTAPILSVSYGECELFNGTSSNAAYNALWQSAASEGIAVFVATGDSGSALCDAGMSSQAGNPWAAQYGNEVSGLASSPYDTAVGGTDFNWGSTASAYWQTTNSSVGSNARGYMPEVPWNDTCSNPLVLSSLQSDATYVKYSGNSVTDGETACNFVATDAVSIFQNYLDSNGNPANLAPLVDTVGGSGGASNCSTNTTAITPSKEIVGTCTSGYPKPSWQTALTVNDGARDLPDVSFFASNGFLGSAYLVCVSANGACVTSTNPTAEPIAQEIGGTSVSTPAMAGVMAMINQSAKSAQGSPNAELYTLAAAQNYSGCSAENVTTLSPSCYFNDVDSGTIAMPCDYGAAEGGIVDTSGTPTYVAANVEAGIKSTGCLPIHSGDKVGLLTGVDAGTGYDLATGLGSLNVANVVTGWTGDSVSPSFYLSGPDISLAAGSDNGITVSSIGVTSFGGFTGVINFACALTSPSGGTNAPSCSVGSMLDIEAADGNVVPFTVNSTTATTTGSYLFTVTGASGTLTQALPIGVTITAAAANVGTFALSTSAPAPTSVAPGGSAVASIAVTSSNGYTGTVTFACTQTSGPTNATADTPSCTFPAGAAAVGSSTQFTVRTDAAVTSALIWPKLSGKGAGWTGAGGGAVLAFLIFVGIPKRRRNWLSMVGMLLALAALGGMAACGGGGGGGGGGGTTDPGTAAGSYVFTVTGTGSPSPSTAPTPVTFTVAVN